jgi:hypothetical protein
VPAKSNATARATSTIISMTPSIVSWAACDINRHGRRIHSGEAHPVYTMAVVAAVVGDVVVAAST